MMVCSHRTQRGLSLVQENSNHQQQEADNEKNV